MFQKPIRVKTQTAIKGSERKRLRAEIQASFPRLLSEDIHALIPTKDNVTCAKVTTHTQLIVLVYICGKNPIFYLVDERYFPTVYTLWIYPQLVPRFITWPVVFTKLAAGADLMLPGVVTEGCQTREMLPDVRLGECCSVSLVGNRSPVAVGVALVNKDEMLNSMRGKGVKVMHCYGDYLWRMGDNSEPPTLLEDESRESMSNQQEPSRDSLVNQSAEITEPSGEGSADVGSGIDQAGTDEVCQEANSDEDNDTASTLTPSVTRETIGDESSRDAPLGLTKEDMDCLLYELFLTALKVKVTKSDLPMLTSIFYRKCLLSCCPVGVTVDVRQSSYKKLSKFLQEMMVRDLVTVKETSHGVDSITEINTSHSILKSFEPKKEYLQERENTPSALEYSPPVIVEKIVVTSQLLPLVSGSGLRKGQVVGVSELREALTEYIRRNDLQDHTNKSRVILDPVLAQVVLKKGENDVINLGWEDIIKSCMAKAATVCEVSVHGQPPVTHKGRIEPVCMDVKQRASNKKVTLVDNVHLYGIDPNEFSQRIKHAISCSVSLVDHPQKHKGHQVVVQGNQIDIISHLLLDVYHIPGKYIRGMEKGVKKKR